MSDGTMFFGDALAALREGKFISRAGWNAHHKLGLQQPDENSANTRPYIYMIVGEDAQDGAGDRLPWVASQTDMLANDWQVVE